MIPETAAEIIKKIGAMLLLGKEETRQRNLLSILGLFHTDFGKSLTVSYDADGILAVCNAFGGTCTCHEDPKFPKTHRIPNDPDFHSSKCDVYRNYALAMHECLQDVTFDKTVKDGTDVICFNFFWPRTLTPKMRNVLVTAFPELQADALWGNFVKGWDRIMKLLPEPPIPYSQKDGEASGSSEPVKVEAESVVAPTAVPTPSMDMGDFDDLDLGGTTPTAPTEPKAEDLVPLEQAIAETAKKRGRGKAKKEPEAEEPKEQAAPKTVEIETEPQASPSGGEQPKTVEVEATVIEPVAEAEEQPQEAGNEPPAPAIDAPQEDKPKGKKKGKEKDPGKDAEVKKIDPARERFVKLILDELNGIKTAVEFIRDADSFPLESVKNLKARLDRLALKTAHLIYRGRHDMDDPSSINPMVEVTLANVSGTVNGAVRDLGLAPEKANSWADFKKEIKTVVDMADSMTEIMSQAGMADIVQEPPKLRDSQGKALVP